MIPVHSGAVSVLPSGAKKNGKIVFDYFAVLAIILPFVWPLLGFSWENRHHLTCIECSCMVCPNVERFCPNNGHFFSVGDVIASLASPCRMLMFVCLKAYIYCTFATN